MSELNPKIIVGGFVALVVLVAAVLGLVLGGDESAPEDAPTGNGGSASVETAGTGEDTTAPSPDATDPATDSPSSDYEQAQVAVATDFVETYYSYSHEDATPNDGIRRAQKFMTPTFFETTVEAFAEFDNPDDYAWTQDKANRIQVTTTVDSATHDVWYDHDENYAVIYLDYHQSTSAAGGTGGTGPGQYVRVEVTKVGDQYLVSNIITEL